MKAWRRKQEGRRLDGFIGNPASWQQTQVAEAWGCSMAAVVDRLALDADQRYPDILFPETE